jgi:hypothetical protein
MTIKSIEIENIKGIKKRVFDLDIIPNKPSILVAPNGFGKSSFAAAFNSLRTEKIHLEEALFHESNSLSKPKIIIKYKNDDGEVVALEANDLSNQISNHFDCFVINSQIKAKGIGQNRGRFTSVSASISIDPIVIRDSIPTKEDFSYSLKLQKENFGTNGKVLPKIETLLSNLYLVERISDEIQLLDQSLGNRTKSKIKKFIDEVNQQVGTSKKIIDWIESNKIRCLDEIEPVFKLKSLIAEFDIGVQTEAEKYLTVIQILKLYEEDKSKFKKACKYKNYILDKVSFNEVLRAINTSWRDFQAKEKKGKLIIEFPKAHHISNGQRDILCFISLLQRARRKLRKSRSILIIDEVFDYLDDANLISAQYYITQFIENYRANNKKIYPLILTHLNPDYFKNYTFSKQKTYFLDKKDFVINEHLIKLLSKRNEELVEEDISKFLFHYHEEVIDKRDVFRTLGLKETWGESNNFRKYTDSETQKYISDSEGEFDPFAVCCSLRIKIEEKVFLKILENEKRQVFLDTKKTKCKLEYAESLGIFVPEYYYLLGIIYNDGMHWKNGQDNISPIVAKLENFTIRKLIKDVFTQAD